MSNINPFPLIPAGATTTKLAEKLEKHGKGPKATKTMFNSGLERKEKLKKKFWLFLIVSDFV